jgi:hypoxanthine phosphoribosyltransferase
MTDKVQLTWQDVEYMLHDIVRDMHNDGWKPDLVVGIDRGGLPISVMLSHYLAVQHENVKVSLRDATDSECESNLWLPELALEGKKILIVDDINDTGATQAWIKKDWTDSVSGVNPNFVLDYWHDSIRWASLVDNEASEETSDYTGMSINKLENDVWIDFPWESWWTRSTV